jgi:hypothetical protein
LVLTVAVALTPRPGVALEPAKAKVVVVPFTGTNTLMRRLAGSLSASMAESLGQVDRVDSVAPGALEAALGPEGLERLAACSGAAPECLATELAPWAPRWVLRGRVVGGGKPWYLELELARLPGAEVVWRDGQRTSEDSEVPEALAAVMLRVAGDAGFSPSLVEGVARLGTGITSGPPPEGPTPRYPAWVLTALGATSAGAGAATLIAAAVPWSRLHSDAWRAATGWFEVRDELHRFNIESALGSTLLGVGLAVLGAGLLWALLLRDAPEPVAVLFGAPGMPLGLAW